MTTVEPTNLRPLTATLVARYAERFNAAFADGVHAVTSPLGAWLLLALVAPAAEGDARARLEDVLGTTADDAFARAGELLATPHPAVGLASGLWARRELLTTAYERFAASLPEVVARGGLPTQRELDAWARKYSLGLIERFPLQITGDTVIVLADALATDVEWDDLFDVVPSEAFRSAWATKVARVLRASSEHGKFIAETDAAGDVAVHTATSETGLTVVSVIADPSVTPSSVHRAAHDVAELVLHRPKRARHRSLFDLPVGEGHAWTITETEELSPDDTERVTAVLPAWESENSHDLLRAEAVGVADAVATLIGMVSPEWPPTAGAAAQAARAQYSARGFRAAAVTAFAVRLGADLDATPPERVPVRAAQLRFDRPYAVVAIALADGDTESVPREAFRWHGVPVFSAWVAEPSEASD